MSDPNKVDNLPLKDNYSVGATVLTGLGVASNPFTDKSLEAFTSNYKNKILTSNPKTDGTFTMECTLAQTTDKRMQAIGASGKLSLTYGPISGDASLNFAMNNGQSSMDVSIIIRGDQAHRLYQSQIEDYNKLKLRDAAKKLLKKGWGEFSKVYGTYLIIGEVKGGNITYQQIYSTVSKSDTLTAGGQLSLAYGKVGFEVKGEVKGNFENTTMSTSTTLTTKTEFNPSFVDSKFDNLIKTLGELANPSTIDKTNKTNDTNKSDNNETKEDDNNRTIASQVQDQMQQILSGDRLDITDVIVIPLDKLSSVQDQIQGNKPTESVRTFLNYSNELYMQLVSMKTDLKKISDIWKLDDNNDKNIKNTISLYTDKTDTLKELMGYIADSQLVNLSNERKKFLESDETKENDKKEINVDPKTWYHIRISKLKEQFESDILDPYNNRTENTTKKYFVSRNKDNGKFVLSISDDGKVITTSNRSTWEKLIFEPSNIKDVYFIYRSDKTDKILAIDDKGNVTLTGNKDSNGWEGMKLENNGNDIYFISRNSNQRVLAIDDKGNVVTTTNKQADGWEGMKLQMWQ